MKGVDALCAPPLDRKVKRMPHMQNGNMSQRHKIPRHKSRRNFTKHATHTKAQNFVGGVMRGGIRF